MPVQLLDLAAELQNMLIDNLRYDNPGWLRDRVAISLTCRFYRTLLLPDIFNFLVLRNTESKAKAAFALSKTSLRQHVTCIRVEPKPISHSLIDARMDANSLNAVDNGELMPCLHREVWVCEYGQLLYSLGSCFPKLDSVIVSFGLSKGDTDWTSRLNKLWFNENEVDNVRKAMETNDPWMMLLNGTYNALARGRNNPSSQVTLIHLHNVAPVETSVLRTSHFRAFLGRLSGFDLFLCGRDDDSGVMSNTLDGTRRFLAELGELFFKHLQQCKQFMLHASALSRLGLQGEYHIPLSLEPEMIPLLGYLSLEHVFIDNLLCKFLEAHSGTLETVSLCNCFADVNHPDGIGTAWSVLFSRFAASNPAKVKLFEIEDERYGDLEFFLWSAEWEIPRKKKVLRSQMARMKEIFEDGQTRTLFRYAYLDPDDGSVQDSFQDSYTAFVDGHDQIAYNRLTDMIQKNPCPELAM